MINRIIPEESLENIPIDYKKVAITEPDKDVVTGNGPWGQFNGRSDEQTFIRKVDFNILKMA